MMKKLHVVITLFLVLGSTLQAQVIYKDVAPIFYNRCSTCHHAGSQAPYLNYYSSISGYLGLIQNDLTIGKMPPWPEDTTYVRFTHERIITLSEKTKILNWISAGAPYGTTLADTALAPPAPYYPNTKLNGTPDLILTIPSYTSTAATTDKYICFSIPTGLTQNRILKAYEIIPNNATIIHHAVVNVDTMGTTTSDLSGNCINQAGDFTIGDYAPGSNPIVFPSSASLKFGVSIKAGSKFVVQIHYPAGSAGQVDNTQIRLFFYPVGTTNVREMYATVPIQNWNFYIVANTTKTITTIANSLPASSTGALPYDISAYSIFPHSHKICSSITNYASNGTITIPMSRINKWDFSWQGFYTYPNFLRIPAGYKLYGTHVFDNTTNNPNNPTPATVIVGTSTTNEMIFDGLMWTYYKTGDENIDIAGMLNADPLLLPTDIKSYQSTVEGISVFPNPFFDKITVSYDLLSTQYTKLSIANIMGQEIAVLTSGIEGAGKHSYEWDGKNTNGSSVSTGVYMYKLQTGTTIHSGKIILKPKN